MKKHVLTIIISFIFVAEASAVTMQTHYRWRNDNGNEATATWKANESMPVYHEGTDPLRLRIQFRQASLIEDPTDFVQNISLFYVNSSEYDQPNPAWTKVTLDGNNAFTLTPSAYVNDLDPTFERLSNFPGDPFTTGHIFSGTFDHLVTIPSENISEYEWVLQPTANAVPDVYYFKLGWQYVNIVTVPDFGNAAILYYETPLAAVPLRNWAIYLGVIMAAGFVAFRFFKRA